MKKAKLIYHLANDLLRYLLKYGAGDSLPDESFGQMLEESGRLAEAYRDAPDGIGGLAWKLFTATNSWLGQKDEQEGEKGSSL